MKINKAKLLVGTLAVAAVAATVGSISGTVAWFQYSTRSTVAYQGAAAHCSENLQIRLYKAAQGEQGQPDYVAPVSTEWKNDLSIADVSTFLTSVRGAGQANTLVPVTSGVLAAGALPEKLYKNPIYQYADKSDWGEASATDYVDLPLQFRVLDVNGDTANPTYLAKKVYLSDLTLAAKAGTFDATSALRVIVNNGAAAPAQQEDPDPRFQQVFSKSGEDVAVGGELDLNADGKLDLTEGYEWTEGRTTVKYGDYTDEQKTTAAVAKSQALLDSTNANAKIVADDENDVLVADDSDPLDIKGKPLFTTVATAEAESDWAGISIRIYLEGWTKLSTPAAFARSFESEEAMNDAVANDSFVPEVDVNYKAGDKIFKCATFTPKADQQAASATFTELTDGKENTPIWDAVQMLKADDKPVFNVGMRFSAEAHADHE